MNQVGYFEIQADDPKKLSEFYADIFGWKLTLDPNLPIEYYRIETEGINGGLLKRPAAVPPPMSGTNAYVCSMEVADFDATAKKIMSRGGLEAMPKFAVPGKCWQGYFVDPAGNTFGIFQVDESAA